MESNLEILEDTFEEKFYNKKYKDFSNAELINRIRMIETILDSMYTPVFWKNDKFQIVGSNKAFKRYIKMDNEKYIGKTDAEIEIWKSKAADYRKDDEAVLFEGKTVEVTEDVFINETEKRIINTVKSPIRENGKIVAVMIAFKDITEQKTIEDELFKASYTDALTGLYNRAYFDKKIEELDNEADYPLTVAMADVNGLKIMNDTFGHHVGDQVLQTVSDVLRDKLCDESIVARLGGDEFAVIFPRMELEKAESLFEIAALTVNTTKIKSVKLSISYGCATKTSKKEDLAKIFVAADELMYRRKKANHCSYRKTIVNTIMKNLYQLLPDETLHAKLVSKNCLAIAEKINYSVEDRKKLADFAGFHDIGKIGISKELLEKTGPLTEDEWAILKSHSEVGYAILSSSEEYREYANLVLTHHEHYDGGGYPKGLKGKNIPEFSRLLGVADAIASMESTRAYRKALSKEEIVSELKKYAGTQFDPFFAQVAIYLIESEELNVTDYADEKFDLKDFTITEDDDAL